MTVPGPALAGPFTSSADDLDGKEGYAAKISGGSAGDGSEVVTLATTTETGDIDTAVGVITSVAGVFADGTQTATVQFSGVAYAVAGANIAGGAVLSPGAASTWVNTPGTGTDYVKAIALQGCATGALIQVHILGVSAVETS
tara:strand:- start:35 stop:460 length:426 start_codon:yes stop_codon:yes gene_type:complete